MKTRPAGFRVDVRGQVINDQTNLGLLSALMLTVFVTFLMVPASGETTFNEGVGAVYFLSWAVSSVLMLLATMMSIFTLLAVSETSGVHEVAHFMELFSKQTFGLGSGCTLMLMYLSFLSGMVGFVCYLVLYISIDFAAVCFICCCLAFWLFVICYLNMVATLHGARKFTQQRIPYLQEYSSARNEFCFRESFVLSCLAEFAVLDGNIEFIGSATEFETFIMDKAMGLHEHVASAGDTRPTLAVITAKRVEYLYSTFIKDNVSFRGNVD
jgi:hypothetical protein